MKRYETSIVILAPADRIWSILTDAAAYPSWNTTVSRVDGTIGLGQKVTVHAVISPGRSFPVKVAELDVPRRMVWRGGMPLGLFLGERVFELHADGAAQTRFVMHETFSGPMSRFIIPSIPDLTPAFEEFAACLKRKAEAN